VHLEPGAALERPLVLEREELQRRWGDLEYLEEELDAVSLEVLLNQCPRLLHE